MPWKSVLCVLAACRFAGDYAGGDYTCTDGKCPSGLACVAERCVLGGDAHPVDGKPIDARPIDALEHALTCADPGSLAQAASGTTATRTSHISAMCGGLVMNGPDAVYRLDATLGQQLLVTVTGFTAVKAYVLAPCLTSPQTPTCVGNAFASPGNPASITTTTAGAQYVIVDSDLANGSGAYTIDAH